MSITYNYLNKYKRKKAVIQSADDLGKVERPTVHVRDDAGHSSGATTDLYNDSELQARHDSAKNKDVSIRKNA